MPARTPNDPWWADRVFSEVFVGSFADSVDGRNGDLRGLTQRFDRLDPPRLSGRASVRSW